MRNVLSKQHSISKVNKLFVQTPARSAGGGPKKPSMSSSERDFDVVLVGGINTTALTKFLQAEDVPYKMALVTPAAKAIMPTAYFGVSHGHIDG
jgi:hypothetical protein